MKYINKAIHNLEAHARHATSNSNYILPWIFNFFDYPKCQPCQDNQIAVEPYDFYAQGLKSLVKNKPDRNYLVSLSQLHHKPIRHGDWIKEAFVYSSMIRTSSAYDHDQNKTIDVINEDGFKESGTFLKQIFLLPFLKEIGIDTLYLLPFFETSTQYKKGAFGSCYAITNPFHLDPLLADPMLDELTLFEQAKAFFEACHMLDIRVIIDIIPRTSAIDAAMVEAHPDWFYWIDANQKDKYKVPYYNQLPELTPPTEQNLTLVYQDPKTKDFLSCFRHDPKTIDSQRYEAIVSNCRKHKTNFLEAIEQTFNLCIAPAFSDWINDPQPIWSDVTYLRMYFDNHEVARPHIANHHPPYLFFDSAKSNMYPGDTINTQLWDMISNIVPFYQKAFGIDGVRIDMGHALPLDLVTSIIEKGRNLDPDICFIAEELDTDKASISKQKGYNMILGNGFSEESRIAEGRLYRFYHKVSTLDCPVFALSESHDTSRVSAKPGKTDLNIMLTALNLFLPNGVAFLNSGQELFEIQPMNLGLDCPESERYNLPKTDPRYNKLALFDPFYFTYNQFSPQLIDMLKALQPIRQKYSKAIANKQYYQLAVFEEANHYALGAYFQQGQTILFVVINSDLYHAHTFHVDVAAIEQQFHQKITSIEQLYATTDTTILPILSAQKIKVSITAGEVKFIELR